MKVLQRSLIVILFLITATTYSQVALVPSTSDHSGKAKVAAAYQGVYIPNVAIQNRTDAPEVVQKNVRVTSMLVYNTVATKELEKGYYFWNGTQWQVYDTTIVMPNSKLVTNDNKSGIPSIPSAPSIGSKK